MRKTISALLIVFLLSVSVALADSIKGGPTAPPKPGTTTPGIGGAASPVTPTTPGAPAKPVSALYRNGKQWDVETPPLPSPPQGYQPAGVFFLTDANKDLLQKYADKPIELTTMENGKVVFRNPDGTLAISVGARTFDQWTGPDKFSAGTDPLDVSYDGKKITLLRTGDNYIQFADGSTVQGIKGGIITTTAAGVTIIDSQGKTAGTFTSKQWDAWSTTLSNAHVSSDNWVAAVYAIRDLNLNPAKASVLPEGGGFFTPDAIVAVSNGQVTVTRGSIDTETGMPKGAYSQKTFTLANGQQVISDYKEVDDKGQTVSEYTYGDTMWTVSRRDSSGNLQQSTVAVATYNNVKYPALGTVGGVTIVMDPQTKAIRYFGADDKELTGAALDKFLADKSNSEAVDKITSSQAATTAKDAINQNKLASCPESQCGQFNSFGQFLNTFTKYYNNYAGLAGWSSLIFDKKFLADWQKQVNHIMCDQLHLPTQACWTSQICGKYVKIDTPRDGVLITASPGGAIQAVAHIEGQKSLPANTPNATYYTYTVTFGLTNPTDHDMKYNVRFVGDTASPTWWPAAQSLGKGGMVSAIGAEALHKVSSNNYGSVCIEFSPSIASFGGASVSKICNDFAQYTGGATAPYSVGNQTNTTSGAPAGGGASGGAPSAAPGANV